MRYDITVLRDKQCSRDSCLVIVLDTRYFFILSTDFQPKVFSHLITLVVIFRGRPLALTGIGKH